MELNCRVNLFGSHKNAYKIRPLRLNNYKSTTHYCHGN